MVGEAVTHETQFAPLDVLLDRVKRLVRGDLHLGVGPARNLNDHVEDTLALVGEEGDVVERRQNGAILFDEHTMFWEGGCTSVYCCCSAPPDQRYRIRWRVFIDNYLGCWEPR